MKAEQTKGRLVRTILLCGVLVLSLTACRTPVGTTKSAPARSYDQTHRNAVRDSAPGPETLFVLHRFDQAEQFSKSPAAAIRFLHAKAVETRSRELLYALAEMSYLAGDRARKNVKPWEKADPAEFYLASAVYAWFFLFGDAAEPVVGPYDLRFRSACDIYNFGLGQALGDRSKTNGTINFISGQRHLPVGSIEVTFNPNSFGLPVEGFEEFLLAQDLLVRGLTARNRQSGLGAPLVAVGKEDPQMKLSRAVPATALLRIDGSLAQLGQGGCHASLELFSGFDFTEVEIGRRPVPLETDTTAALAYSLNQSLLWRLGMQQFLSFKERVKSDIYSNQPYQRGKIPVVLVHGTFSSPVWWAEMFNTLYADPELRKHCQFWWFIYNSGNPTSISAVKLREALSSRIKALDPEGDDATLQSMVVIGHSQGGLLTKLTATDTGDQLLKAVLKTNRLEDLGLRPDQQEAVRKYTVFTALPFVKRVVFISTPHRGSYLAGSFARRLARKLVSLPGRMVKTSTEFVGIKKKLNLPKDLQGTPTSLDSMSPNNPVQLALAEIPLAPGVTGHSIVAVKGKGDYRKGKDGLVAYSSAHVDYVASEFIVRGPHSCQGMPATIEEVRRILREHLASVSGQAQVKQKN
jgi:pimeloyl-ACP methyl ester carboxylesterase